MYRRSSTKPLVAAGVAGVPSLSFASVAVAQSGPDSDSEVDHTAWADVNVQHHAERNATNQNAAADVNGGDGGGNTVAAASATDAGSTESSSNSTGGGTSITTGDASASNTTITVSQDQRSSSDVNFHSGR